MSIIALFLFTACNTAYVPVSRNSAAISIDSTLPIDTSVSISIAPYKKQLDAQMQRVIGFSAQYLPKEKEVYELALGNFMADLMLHQARKVYTHKVDMAAITFGGIRTGIKKGAITVGDIFELMPFENEMQILTLDQQTVLDLFNYMVQRKNIAIANTRVIVQNDSVQQIYIGDQLLENKTYTLAISDYLAGGGDQMYFLKNIEDKHATQLKIRDVIITHLEEMTENGQMIEAEIEGRVIIK